LEVQREDLDRERKESGQKKVKSIINEEKMSGE
jgi:hypothetical protein